MQTIDLDPVSMYLIVCGILVFILPMLLAGSILHWVRKDSVAQEMTRKAERLISMTTGSVGVLFLLGSIPIFSNKVTGFHLISGFAILAISTWTGTWYAMKRVRDANGR